jgi:hypothetical protein
MLGRRMRQVPGSVDPDAWHGYGTRHGRFADVALPKKWVPPWRGPNPVRKTAALVLVTVTTVVGAWAFRG